ncbi:MAG: class I SAM-dependent methyltransferase [Myxococcales bacterium]|nr:class I SAM-dependent methyltransferase [Myxococcales bacterium]
MLLRRALPLLLLTACSSPPPANSPEPTPPRADVAAVIVEPPTSAMAEKPEPAPKPKPPEPIPVPEAIAALMRAPDRSEADRALDAGRKEDQLLAFIELQSGAKVAELGAGSGYTTEILARAVGPKGKVYAQNNKFILERFAEKPLTERMKKPVMKNVTRLDREFDDPFPKDVKDLDAVVNVLFYHDTFWMKVDRDKMNKAVFKALRPRGLYVIVDHSAQKGHGAEDVKTLHRVEKSVVQQEIERAGFHLAKEGHFLENPEDSRDWSASPGAAGDKRGSSDRFVLVFEKPDPKSM